MHLLTIWIQRPNTLAKDNPKHRKREQQRRSRGQSETCRCTHSARATRKKENDIIRRPTPQRGKRGAGKEMAKRQLHALSCHRWPKCGNGLASAIPTIRACDQHTPGPPIKCQPYHSTPHSELSSRTVR